MANKLSSVFFAKDVKERKNSNILTSAILKNLENTFLYLISFKSVFSSRQYSSTVSKFPEKAGEII